MNAIQYAEKKIVFNESSPITGRFQLSRYPFLGGPLSSLDDIYCKVTTNYKASQSLGTQLLLIATSYRLDIKRKTVYAIAQADADAESWAKRKVNPFLKRIPSLRDSVRTADKTCIPITNMLWLWPNHTLMISGPGLNAQNSIDACYLHMDEGHLYAPGTFAAFDDRMGGRWDRNMFNVTTAADAGHEVDGLFYKGDQNEWHQMCPKCHNIFQPLWFGPDIETYDQRIFVYRDSGGESSILDSIHMVCPHCQKEIYDNPHTRIEMDEGARYVPMNPNAERMYRSFRWNAFAVRWRKWRDRLATYLLAMEAAKLGDLSQHENWIKKHECRSYVPELPDFGTTATSRVFSLGELMPDEPQSALFMFADYQAGKASEGAHLWVNVAQYTETGDSRRIGFRKIETFEGMRAWQLELGIHDNHCGVDCGHDNRTVFKACAKYHWFALKGTDTEDFYHEVIIRNSPKTFAMPYSMPRWENGNAGAKSNVKLKVRSKGRRLPGWCLTILVSNPKLYGYLYALQSGQTGRKFEIPDDMPKEYSTGFPAFMPKADVNRKTRVEKIIWVKIKTIDHPWDCEIGCLVLAMKNGYYPLAEKMEKDSE